MSPTHGPGSKKKTRLTPSKSAEVSPSVQHLQVTMTAVTGTTTPSSSSQTNHHKHQTTDKVAEVSTSDAGNETASSSPQLRASSSPNSSPGKTSAAGKAAAVARPFRQKFIKSPLFQQADKATCGSPGLSPMTIAALTPTVVDTAIPSLPPPVQDGRSEAIAALQDAANGSVKTKSGGIDAQTSSGTTGSSANLAASLSAATSGQLAPPTHQLPHQAMSSSSSSAPHAMQECANTAAMIFDSSFFSVVMLVHWSNVVGPKVKKVWSGDPVDDQLLITIARQVLNGEMGRELSGIEPKWLVLHRQGLICAAFLFQEPVSLCLSALVMVVPVRYLRNFAQYFSILAHRIPTELIDVIIHLRKSSRRLNIPWSTALDYFSHSHLFPFVQSVMDLESVSLPADSFKILHTLFTQDTKPHIDQSFLIMMITAHLQSYGSTLLIGKNLTSMNMVINTLALFLSSEERCRSSHARKNHKYQPHLYLQGLLLMDMEASKLRLELLLMNSPLPTTVIDLSKMQIKQTLLQPSYRRMAYQWHDAFLQRADDELAFFATNGTKSPLEPPMKRPFTLQRTECEAPMIQTLVQETFQLPGRLRESYVRKWRQGLIKQAAALVKFVQDESSALLAHATSSGDKPSASMAAMDHANDIVQRMMEALGIATWDDFLIILTQADKLRPGMVDFVDSYSKRL